MSKVIAVANQKGGVGKTSVVVNLGIGLARSGHRVLLIDADPQGSLTISLGNKEPDKLSRTITEVLMNILREESVDDYGILHHSEGVDYVPANIELANLEVTLVNSLCREYVLKKYVELVRLDYDYILIDCMPSLGMMTTNALACADSVLIPVQASYLSVKGLLQLERTITRVRSFLNEQLYIEGIVINLYDCRTNYARDISQSIAHVYDERVYVFKTIIPSSVRVAESSAAGQSIFLYDPTGKATEAYLSLLKEVRDHE